MKKIVNSVIKDIEYVKAEILFDKINRKYRPTLLTGEGPKDISGISIIAIDPYKDEYINHDIWNKLRELNNSTNFHELDYPANQIGAIGSISYEALHHIEDVEKHTEDNYKFPLINWTIYKQYYYFDNINQKAWHIELTYEDETSIIGSSYLDDGFKVDNITPDYTPAQYKNNVQKIREYIFNGDVYEVNLTQGLNGDFTGSPYSLFKKLYNINKAPLSAYMERDNYTVVSNSPELFLRCNGREVETRPIKGTAPRSDNFLEDEKYKDVLFNSEKNQAELFMIVDLMRNDLSRVCKVGSVIVDTKKRIEHYKNVHHLVSIVKGELDYGFDYIDLIKATFPGGSITGCPKVRCMEITEELEKSSRNIYTGSIFLMNQNLFNSSIVIRTSIIKDNKIFFNSGGAITIDSDPQEEYEESLIKLKSILKAVDYEGNL